MGALGVLLGLAFATACGLAMQRALCNGGGNGSGAVGESGDRLAVRCAYGWGLGCLTVALAVFLLGLAHLPITAGSVALGPLCGAVAATAWNRRQRPRDAVPAVHEAARDAQRDAPESGRARTARRAFLTLAAAVVVAATLLSMDHKAMFSDVRTVWLLKSRVVFHDGGLDGAYWDAWTDAHDRRGYPPLVSFVGAWEYLLAGRTDDGLAKLMFGGFLAALLVLVHDALARRVRGWLAALATLCFALSTQTFLLTAWGLADLPLACFLCAAVHALSDGPHARPALAGLMLAGAAFTKLEGLAAVPAVCGAAWLLGTPSRSPRTLCALALPAALTVGAWLLFLRSHGIPILVGPEAETSGSAHLVGLRLAVVARQALHSMLMPGWLVTWPLFALSLLFVARAASRAAARTAMRVELRLRALVVVALALAYAAVYAVQAGDIDFLARTTVGRLMYHAFPLAFVVVVVWLGESRTPDDAASSEAAANR